MLVFQQKTLLDDSLVSLKLASCFWRLFLLSLFKSTDCRVSSDHQKTFEVKNKQDLISFISFRIDRQALSKLSNLILFAQTGHFHQNFRFLNIRCETIVLFYTNPIADVFTSIRFQRRKPCRRIFIALLSVCASFYCN